jgi:putative cell wall-binding protein
VSPSRAIARSASGSTRSRRRFVARPVGALLAAALALPGVALVATSANAVVPPPAISEVAGFPVDHFASDPGISTLNLPAGKVGNLVLVAVDTHDLTDPIGNVLVATGVSSPKTTGWHSVASIVDATHPRNLSLFEGTVTTAGTDTLTVTYSGLINTSYTEIDADELESTAGSGTAWGDVAAGSLMKEPASPGVDAIIFPTLTASSAAAQAYWGFGSSNNGNNGAVSPGGFAQTVWPGLSDNVTILNTALTPSHAYSPTSPQFPNGDSTAVGTIVSASGTSIAPGAPGTPVAVGGNAQATVSWSAPTTGGGGITGYTVIPNPACGGCGGLSPTGTSTTVTGLTNGQAYTFTVTGTNPVGTGPASSASNSVTPAITAPGAPTAATATAGNTQATVSWTVPTSNGGSAITSYTVIPNPACGLCTGVTVTGAPPTTSTTVAGLTNGTAYTFTVTATNAVGTGAASSPSNSVTPAVAAPGAPTAVTATAGNAQATVSWTAPSSGTTPTSYTVVPNPACGGCGGLNPTGVSTTVTGLTNGTPYTFTVTSNPGGGTSAASAAVTPTAPSGGSGGGGGGGTASAPVRVSGADRFGTAIAASTAEFPTAGSAGAVVLARSDSYPDALVGSPLAKAKNGPLLFAAGGVLTPETTAEIQRVLPAGGTVYILGGTSAVPASVATTLTGLGFTVTRLSGADRYATAVAVAGAIGNPGTVLLATGNNFPDALSAGPAAAHLGGAVLLTNGSTLPSPVSAYLTAHPGTVYAIGGPATLADPSATPLTGADRYATAAAVAGLFSSPTLVGVASGVTFPDALTGGAYEAHVGGPLLLTDPATLPGSTSSYLTGAKASIVTTDIFGGSAAISAAVQTAIGTALGL